MLLQLTWDNQHYSVNLAQGIDATAPVRRQGAQMNAFDIPFSEIKPLKMGDFIGSVLEGGPVNCEGWSIYPHGNGTHTETIGHIASEPNYLSERQFGGLFLCDLVTLSPASTHPTPLILLSEIEAKLTKPWAPALAIRADLIIDDRKQWSGMNPAAIEPALTLEASRQGVIHLLTNLPSIDPEEDEGRLTAHRAFWNYPVLPRKNACITEMVCFPETLADGRYLVQIAVPAVETDAAPSRVTFYELTPINRGV